MMMNWFDPSDAIARRVVARTGVEHPHADLDSKRTALVVVDLQNAFMDEEVGHAVCPMAREIVPNVNRLASVVRGVGALCSGSRTHSTITVRSNGATRKRCS